MAKRKPNSNKKRAKQIDDIRMRKQLANIGVMALPGEEYEIVNLKTGDFPQRTKSEVEYIANAMIKNSYLWTVTFIGCLRINGKPEFKIFDAPVPHRCNVSLLDDSIGDHIDKMVKSINPKYFLAVGWIAAPYVEEVPMEVIDSLCDKLGVWEKFITSEEDANAKAA